MSSRGGTSQAGRMPAALAPHYVDVDELSLAQLLRVALDSAATVRFAGATADTSWEPYFRGDEIIVIAEILTTRVLHEGLRFEAALARDLAAGDDASTGAADIAREWAARLRDWAGRLLAHGGDLGADMGAMLEALLKELGYGALGNQAAQLQTQARLHTHAQRRPPAPTTSGPALRANFHQLMKAVELGQRAAAARLPHALRSGRHDPGIGMLVAFAGLYGRAQEKLNRFTERHLDFYYDRVLHVRPRGAERDAAFLVFDPAPPGIAIPVERGSRFLAPYARGAPELEFATEHAMVVTDARVVALHTVYFERNRLSFPEARMAERIGGHERAYPTACRVNPVTPGGPAAGRDGGCEGTPLFGAPRSAAQALPGAVGRIGFALASNVLLMRHGEREVGVVLHLGSAGGAHAPRLRERMHTLLGEIAREGRGAAAAAAQADPMMEDRVLARLFRLSISSSGGWIGIPGYDASFAPGPEGGAGADLLSLRFRLGAELPAVVPYAPALHGEDWPANCPVLRVELNPLAYVYGYGLLRGLPLLRAEIEVEVRGHRALHLQNHIGLLSAAAPFQPFGPLPAVGAYLIVGSAETACKDLTGFELVMDWANLPRAPRGLGWYYADYAREGRASPFRDVRASLSVLADGAWVPAPDTARPQVTLFHAAAAAAGGPEAVSRLRFDRLLPQARRLDRADAATDAAAPFVYTPGLRGGFFKITLGGPDFLFGHADYPYVLADTLSHNGQPRNRARLRELPAPPYTPLLDAVSLNYRARATIGPDPGPDGDAFIRLSPLGWDAARGAQGRDLLLPRFDDAGNLHIGLAASDLAAPLTLFFHLREDALPMVELSNRALRWSYLAGNVWHPLKPHAVRADSTHAFLRPGIVTLTLPPDISRDNTELPGGLYWLRVSCDTGLDRFCTLYSVTAHAAQVFRDLDAVNAPGAPAAIAPGTITRPRQPIPGLGRVTQVGASSGGRLAETREDMRRRVAERLRHRGQAILPEDYERLVLQQFPEIDRVKCFPNLSVARRPRGECCPGHVLVVGLPAFHSDGHLREYPRLNGWLVGKVRSFLEAHMSPNVTLEVVNPVYQHIQVRCTVVLRAGADLGWYANLLDTLVSDFISPWNQAGNTSHFGWRIRRHDIESFILAQEGVLAVSGFSMLSVSGRDLDLFSLKDTAARGPAGAPPGEAVIEPAYPWSIAVPIRRHHIAVVHAGAGTHAVAEPTGLGRMEIGSTFIIGAKRNEE